MEMGKEVTQMEKERCLGELEELATCSDATF
jgi:hypothetical protein